jgi:hypothetical protein
MVVFIVIIDYLLFFPSLCLSPYSEKKKKSLSNAELQMFCEILMYKGVIYSMLRFEFFFFYFLGVAPCVT